MKNMNKKYIIFAFIALGLLIIAIPTTYKIIKNYNNKSYLVVEKKITEAARKCFNEEKCSGDKTTLKQLYDNGYLETVINPVTNKIYDDNLEIKKSEDGYIVNVR